MTVDGRRARLQVMLLRSDDRAELHVSGDAGWVDADMLARYVSTLCEMDLPRVLVDVREVLFDDPVLLEIMLAPLDVCARNSVAVEVRTSLN